MHQAVCEVQWRDLGELMPDLYLFFPDLKSFLGVVLAVEVHIVNGVCVLLAIIYPIYLPDHD